MGRMLQPRRERRRMVQAFVGSLESVTPEKYPEGGTVTTTSQMWKQRHREVK